MSRGKQERSSERFVFIPSMANSPNSVIFSLFLTLQLCTIICRYSMTYDLAMCSSLNCNAQNPEVADHRTDAEECVEHSSHVAFFVIGRAWHPGAKRPPSNFIPFLVSSASGMDSYSEGKLARVRTPMQSHSDLWSLSKEYDYHMVPVQPTCPRAIRLCSLCRASMKRKRRKGQPYHCMPV